MIDYKDILYFDTETTGLPPRNASWETEYESFPHICQLSWIYKGIEENHIIRPDGWIIPEETTAVHGITTEYAKEHGEPFADVVGKFLADAHEAKLICGHNIYFDVSILKSELMRLKSYDDFADDALFKGKRIDTMRPSMQFVDARFSNGRLKFPRLEELYARCFPGETFPAHDAIEDVKAVVRCLPVLVQKGIIVLEVKEYHEIQVSDEIGIKEQNQKEKEQNCATSEQKVLDVQTAKEQEKTQQAQKDKEITNRFADMMADTNF